jgi:hypothetical protein
VIRDPRLPRRLVDVVAPEREREAEIAAIGKRIREAGQAATDRAAEVVDRVIEATTAARREAAKREREARKARLAR